MLIRIYSRLPHLNTNQNCRYVEQNVLVFRRSSNWHLPAIVPPGTTDHRKRRRRQQLRQRSLHRRQGDCGPGAGQNPKTGRPVHGAAGISGFPFIWGRHWIGIRLPPSRTSLGRLRQKVEAGVLSLPGSSNFDSRRGTL